MDIPLVIRGVSSLEEALDLYACAHSLFQVPVMHDGLGAHLIVLGATLGGQVYDARGVGQEQSVVLRAV
jgi:hypothetical protein